MAREPSEVPGWRKIINFLCGIGSSGGNRRVIPTTNVMYLGLGQNFRDETGKPAQNLVEYINLGLTNLHLSKIAMSNHVKLV